MKNTFLIGLVRPDVRCSHCFMALIGVNTNCAIIVRIRCVFRKKETVCEIWIYGNYKMGKIVYNYNNQSL